MSEIKKKKGLKEKTKEFFSKHKQDFIDAGHVLLGGAAVIAGYALSEAIQKRNDYKNGTDFERYVMDNGGTARDARITKAAEIKYARDTEKTLGIPLGEKWSEYEKEHPEEFIKW